MMGKILKKYSQIYWLFFKNSLSAQMQYRFNFAMGILVDCVFFLNKLIYALIVYQTGSYIEGLSPDEVLLYVGTFSIVQGLYTTFFLVNLNQTLPESIRTGDLDLYMVKPISLQFMVSCQYIELSTMIPDLLGGIVVVCIAASRLGLEISTLNVLGYAGLIVIGVMLSYGILFSIQLLAFFFIKIQAISDLTGELFGLNNLPSKVYHKSIQFIGTFVVPIFLVTNLAPRYLMNRLGKWSAIGFICITIAILMVCRKLWKRVLRAYTSACS